jgi:hypothetical protein
MAASETTSSVSILATAFTVLAADANRLSATIFNDSTTDVYVKFGSSASTSDFKVKLGPGDYYEFPRNQQDEVYKGIVTAIGSSATGSLRVTNA